MKSPWWFPKETFDKLVGISSKADIPISSVARAGLAVPPRWNPEFESMISFTTLVSGFAYKGIAAPQYLFEQRGEKLSGGFVQLWIPNLKGSQVLLKNFGGVGF
ncbi:hypothetical protein [Pseudomonas fluorescens]|uniref:hypothetical protein n=1 Tax=Pseudomonas fluorescens TaxID=294 RepID=UPI001240EDB9|nr:hypothetical protein [Pseudomonas fluorescens]